MPLRQKPDEKVKLMIKTLRKGDGDGERESVLYLEGGGGGEETSGEVSAYESGGCNA